MKRPRDELPGPPPPSEGRPTSLAARDAAAIALIATPVLVNLLGYLFFAGHPLYAPAQGLGTLFFYLGLLSAPAGALYWRLAVGLIARNRRAGAPSRRLGWGIAALVYAVVVLAGVLEVGWAR